MLYQKQWREGILILRHLDKNSKKIKEYVSNEGMENFVMLTLHMIAIPLRFSRQIKIINLAAQEEIILPYIFQDKILRVFSFPETRMMCINEIKS